MFGKRVLTGILAVLLILSMVACAGTPAPQATGTAAATAAPTASAATKTAEPTAEATPEPEAQEPLEISWMSSGFPLEDDSWGENIFNETFNVKLTILRAEDDSQRNVLFASGIIPDYISLGGIDAVTDYTNQGLLAEIPIELIEENMPGYYALCLTYDENFFRYSIVDGQNMGLPKLSAVQVAPVAAAIRADWLKNVGITKVPSTLEELEQAFVAFVENDPDQNGKKDTYAMSSAGGEPKRAINRRLFPSIFGIYGVNPFWWTDNGEGGIEHGFTSERFKEALELLVKWYQMGLIDPEFVTDELRNSGEDVVFKFASGRTGYIDGAPYDDYEWDNDGHVNAKWVANNPAWQDYFAENAESDDLYKYVNTTDFDDSFIEPYYINMPPVAGPYGNVEGYMRESIIGGYFGMGYTITEEKMVKILGILEMQAMDEDTYVLHYGPEGEQWLYADDGTRVYNPGWTESANYHPQGRIMGAGFCLFPMYYANPDFLAAVGGPRYVQRYDESMPVFTGFTTFQNELPQATLNSVVEYPNLVETDIISYIIRVVRGDMDLESTYEQTMQKWFNDGGTIMTQEANDFWKSFQ
ncbi:MAG: hypothetical protein ACOX8S_08500 [Christensenellales bacterium]|jgi:putative aldouronate transport system substrate-binding protein